jgi:membrane protein YdbS with pleckstrin-like domain
MLSFFAIEAVGVAVDQWFGHSADPASSIASAAAVPIFAVVAMVSLVPLYFYFHNLDQPLP